MPNEKFYNSTVVEGEHPEPASGDMFAAEWAPDGPYVIPGSTPEHPNHHAVVNIAGVYLDASGVKRLQAVLRRASRKSSARQ